MGNERKPLTGIRREVAVLFLSTGALFFSIGGLQEAGKYINSNPSSQHAALTPSNNNSTNDIVPIEMILIGIANLSVGADIVLRRNSVRKTEHKNSRRKRYSSRRLGHKS